MLHAGSGYLLLAVVVAASIAIFLRHRARVAHKTASTVTPQGELSFRTVANAVPAFLWTALGDGSVDFMGDQLYEYGGLSEEQGAGWGWKQAVHPDDLAACMERWLQAIKTGERYEIEYRLRRADGAYRWFLARANPLRDDQGRIVKWIGTCTDIEDQKHNQQILEQEIKERTEELADANTKLHEEMWEKDTARRELDQQNEKMLQDLTARSQRATLLAKMGELLQSCISKTRYSQPLSASPRKFFPPVAERWPCLTRGARWRRLPGRGTSACSP